MLIPVFHPSAVLRNGGAALAQARADFVVVKRALARRHAADDSCRRRRTTADETHALGRRVGALLRAGDVVVLAGELGTGKTVFAQGFAVALGISEPVVSPTFTVVREYDGPRRSCTSTSTGSTTCRSCSTSGSTTSSGSDAVTVVEWGDG